MAEKPIKGSEIVDNGIFDNLYKEADLLIAKEKELIATNKEVLKSYRDIASNSNINNSADLKAQAENTNKVNESIKNLTQSELYLLEVEKAKKQLEQEDIKLKRAIENENKRLQKSLNDLNGSYKKGASDLALLKKQLKELEFTGRTNGKLYKSLTNEFNLLDAKVRKAEKSVGEFNRNVGNYPKALEGIGSKLLAAFSVGSVVAFGKKVIETRAEFQKFEAVLTNTLGSSSAAKRSLEQIQQIAAKTPFSVKELTESYVKLVNQGFKPTTAEITKLGDLAASQGKSFDQLTEGIIDAQTGEFERLKEFGIRAQKEGDKVKFTFKGVKTETDFTAESIRKYVLSLGDLEGVSGGMAAISETLGGKISNLGDNFDSLFNLIGESGEGFFSTVLDGFNGLLGSAVNLQKTLNKVENSLKAVNQQQTLGEKIKGETETLVEVQILLDGIANSSLSGSQKLFLYGKEIVALTKSYKSGAISISEYQKSLTLLGNSIKDTNEVIKESQNPKEKDNELTKEQIRLAKELEKANKDLNNQLIKLRIDNTQINERQEIDNAKNEKRLAEERLAESKGSAKTKAQIQLALDEQLRQKLAEINDKYRKEEKDKLAKENEDKLKAEKETDDKIINQTQETANRLQEIADQNKAKEDKKTADRKAKREKDLKDTLEFGEQLLDAVSAQIAKESELKEAAINKDIENTNKNIETQRQLAQAGKENTLVEEEAAKNKKELALKEEKEAEIKRQKALLFVKSVMSFIDKGDEPAVAFGKAAASMALVEVASAAFIEGTENVGKDKQFAKNKFSNGTDGYVARFDGDERILNPEQNKKIGNLSNEALADLAYQSRMGLLDTAKYAVVQSTDFATKINDSALLQQNALLIKELKEVKQAINDKPVPNFAMNQYHEFVLTTIENGFIKNRTFKNRKSRIC